MPSKKCPKCGSPLKFEKYKNAIFSASREYKTIQEWRCSKCGQLSLLTKDGKIV